jgi:hypothetical protein
MPPKQSRQQKVAAAANKAEQRAAKREAQTAEETRAELERQLRNLQTPLDRRRTSDRLDTAYNSLK